MSSATQRVDLALAMLPWLAAHPGVDKQQAADRFGISVAQLDALLGLMFYLDIPEHPTLWFDIHYLDDDTVTVEQSHGLDRPLMLRTDEAATLILGLRQLAAQPWLTERQAVDSALAKLEALTGSEVPQPAPVPGDPAIAATVAAGLSQQKRIRLRYHSAGSGLSEREVDPIRMVTADGQSYLQAWCHSADAIRTFRLDRIERAELLDTAADPVAIAPADPGYQAAPDDLSVVLELEPQARWVTEYYPVAESTELDDGRLRVVLRSPSADWLRRLVMRLGESATVLAPESLAVAVRREASVALAAYPDD